MSQKQQQQKQIHDLRACTHRFTVGDLIYARGYGSGQSNWISAHIVQRTGPVAFKVICRRHQDRLRKWFKTVTEATTTDVDTDLTAAGTFSPIPLNISEPTPNVPAEPDVPAEPSFVQNPPFSPQKDHEEEPREVVHRYSTRERRPPQRLTDHHPNN